MANQPLTGDRLRLRDLFLATVAAFVFFAVYWFFSVPGLDPALWEDYAVASGLFPPRTVFPAFWRHIVSWMISEFGIVGAENALRVSGAVVGSLDVFFVYIIVRQILAFLNRVPCSRIWNFIASFSAMLAAVCFGSGDSMWRMVTPLTPGALRFLATLVSLHFFLRYLKTASAYRAVISMLIAGAVASESPLAFVLPVVYYVAYRMAFASSINGNLALEVDIDTLKNGFSLPRWRMFFAFLIGLGTGCWFNITSFENFGGAAINEWDGFDVALKYLVGYYAVFRYSSSFVGWILGFTFVILPLGGALLLYPRLCRNNAPLMFKMGVLFFFAGVISIVQCGVLPFMSIWNFSATSVHVASDYLEAVYCLCCVVTMALSLSCLTVASQNRYEYDIDDERFKVIGRNPFFLRVLAPFLAVICTVPVLVRIHRPVEAEMRSIIDDALAETVRECADARFIFTDGRLDAGLELKAVQMGAKVRPLNMMGGGSNWERHMRSRLFDETSTDREIAETGAPGLLRVWVESHTNALANCAMQLGFEVWRRARKSLPTVSGFVARQSGLDEAESKRGIAAAEAIAARIVSVSKTGKKSPSYALRSALSAVSWRISRFSRMREDDELADELDNSNEVVKQMMQLVERERMRAFFQMTPYEGLRLALHRADFDMARRYGATVLAIDPDDPEANFGTGMAFLVEGKLKKAEIYLERALKKRPGEPAILNNLSIICRRTMRLERALEYAKKAHERMPDNEEIRKTLREAEKALEKKSK